MIESHFARNYIANSKMCPQRKWCGLKQNVFFDASMFPFPQKVVGHFLNYQTETKRLQARHGHYSE